MAKRMRKTGKPQGPGDQRAMNVEKDEEDRISRGWNMAYLFPEEIVAAREKNGLVILPVAPIEWHGPHLSMGCDPLLAHAFASRLSQELECPYYPPLFIGTERERTPEQLRAIGFKGDEFIEGMDFPGMTVGSGYYREEVFAAVVRDTLNILFGRMKFTRVLIVNGHGAVNQKEVIERLCLEYNAGLKKGKRMMWTYPGFPHYVLKGSIAHAGAEEASLLSASYPECVDVSRLPKTGKLKNTDFAIIDGQTFDGDPTPDYTVREEQDPRKHTDSATGEKMLAQAVQEVAREARKTLLGNR
jgi:creatinine amidohydrolase